jgi:polyhydroxyalkanoate synthase
MGGLVEALRDGELDPESMIDWTGNVPPHIVGSFFRIRKPTVELVQYANLWENLWNDEFLSSYQAMARWASTHVPVPGALFRQLLKGWLYDNGFVNGTLRLAGRRVDLAKIAVPMLSVVAMRDDVVPPPAALPVGSLVDVPEFELFEVPAGHAGLAGSRKAVHVTFPGVVDWLRRHSDTKEPVQ